VNRFTLPLEALPESLRVGLRVLLVSTAAMLATVAVLGLIPRTPPGRERLPSHAACARW
jgi:hypothetical protein